MSTDRSTETDGLAVRHTAALTWMDHVGALSVTGRDAFDALDLLCSGDLFVRDGQMLHTLMLDANAHPFADLYICCDDDRFILLVEGPTAAEVIAHAATYLPSTLEVRFTDLSPTHRTLSINGPWSWEVLACWHGPEVVGVPYLTFFHTDDAVCFRAGKTGEYGYDLLIERGRAEAVHRAIVEAGREHDLGTATRETLDVCALENGFFSLRNGRTEGVTPIELQLQWRVSHHKRYVGSEALARARETASRRITFFTADAPVRPGDAVTLGGDVIGQVHHAAPSLTRRGWIGQALIDLPFAHPTVSALASGTVIETVSAPLIDNLSLYVDPRRHTYSAADEVTR